MADECEIGLFHESLDLLAAESQPPMRMLFAQEFVTVRREIDDDEAAAGPQRACRFAHRAGGIIEVVQDLMDDDEIIGIALDRQSVEIALPQMHIAQSRTLQSRARDIEHGRTLIDADRLVSKWRDELEHAAGAGAEIENSMKRRMSDHLSHCRLDQFFRHMQRANAIPMRCLSGEIAGGLLGAGAPDFVEPSVVRKTRRIGMIDVSDDVAGEPCPRAVIGDQEEGPCPLAVALHQSSFNEQFQMTRNARLRLAKDCDELADG